LSVERRTRDHTRSIHKLAYSQIVQNYCLTGSADGDIRIWVRLENASPSPLNFFKDLRDLSKSVLKIHHPTSVRALAFSPSQSNPLHTLVGLENGDYLPLKVNQLLTFQIKSQEAYTGQRHSFARRIIWHEDASWDLKSGQRGQLDRLPVAHAGAILALNWFPGALDREVSSSTPSEGWVATGGLDRCVKVLSSYFIWK
jgi:WD40 repeat protein